MSLHYTTMVEAPKILAIIFCLYVIGFFLHAAVIGKTVYGDGQYYFSWLHSMAIDGDSDFRNEYTHFRVGSFTTALGKPANKYGIGPSIIWLPYYTLFRFATGGSGYGWPYQIGIGLVGVFLAYAGLVFLYLTGFRMFGKQTALLATAGIALATNLLFYGSVDTVNSHSVSFFLACLLLYLVTDTRNRPFFTGLILGLSCTVRLQDAVLGLLLLIRGRKAFDIRTVLGLITGFLPQMIAWKSVYGSWIVNAYAFEGETFRFFDPHIPSVLFSPQYGLFTWAPLLFCSVIFLGVPGRFRMLRMISLAVIIVQIIAVSSWSTYWQGASYGGRMFVSCLPLFYIGSCRFFGVLGDKKMDLRSLWTIIVLPLGVLNAIGIAWYLITH
jgi:hypothetical protein